MIKTTVNFSQFCDSFSDTYKNNFTYEGKRALFDYLESISEDTGDDIELDTVALCCEYSQYDDMADYKSQYPKGGDTLEEIEDHTQVIRIPDSESFIIAQY